MWPFPTAAIGETLIKTNWRKILIWKDLPGFEGLYQVSDTGLIKSLPREVHHSDGRIQHRKERLLSQHKDQDGYFVTKLSVDGLSRQYPVHRLVAIAFIGNIPDGYDVDHIDFDRANNNASNLRIVTHTENIRHTIDANRHATSLYDYSGENNPNYGNHLLSKRYSEDVEFAKEKQSRPGKQNGRCRPVRLHRRGYEDVDFWYIRECAEYIQKNIPTRAKTTETLALRIKECATSGEPYCGMTFEFI